MVLEKLEDANSYSGATGACDSNHESTWGGVILGIRLASWSEHMFS
jgi:hypothetical protein